METRDIHAITGAFGYTGKYIAKLLLEKGEKVITLTNSLERENDFEGKVKAYPFNFDKPEELQKSLQGVKVLYNTYWVRFNHELFQHGTAVENTLKLFVAAKKAGVERIIHVSISNADKSSHLEYFSGKGKLEEALINSKMSYCILRPTVIFGREDILINNIAWVLRKLPVFGVYGKGEYRLQPIHVEDMAEIAVREAQNRENKIIEAIGPETFTYKELVKTIGEIIGKRRKIISVSDGFGYFAGKIISSLKGDVTITREEIDGLSADLLYTDAPPAGKIKLTEWAEENKNTLGVNYASELRRRKDRKVKYI